MICMSDGTHQGLLMVKKAQINPADSNSRNFPNKRFCLAGWEQQVSGCRWQEGEQGDNEDSCPLWVIYSHLPQAQNLSAKMRMAVATGWQQKLSDAAPA